MPRRPSLEMKAFGKRIRLARKQAGIIQEQLAQRIGTGYQSVLYWETGRRVPSTTVLFRLCLALKVSPGWLFGGDNCWPNGRL